MTNLLTRRAVLALSGLALVAFLAPKPSDGGEDPSRAVSLTFSKPISLPGVTLGAGTYIFERAAPQGAIDVVRVSSKDRRFVYYSGFTELVNRPVGKNLSPIVFGEAVAGAPVPIKEWFPTAASTGHRFNYR